VFEISDVVLLDAASEVGAVNQRRLGAAICNKSPGFEVIQGLLDLVMQNLGVPFVGDQAVKPAHGYYLLPSQGLLGRFF
jgi:phenylalanyl-tRNA synthetase beta chain